MQYVEVAVNTKTNKTGQLFTYSIPPQILPYIKVGVLVEIPFRNRKLTGVVIEIKKYIASQIRYKLKPISNILTKFPILDNTQLELAKWLSNYYFSSLGQVISFMIPPISKRNTRFINIVKSSRIRKQQQNIYTLYATYENRFKNYIALIKKAYTKEQQVLILFPEVNLCFYFVKILEKYFKNKIAIIHSGLKDSEKFTNWLEIKNGNKNIIVGTRSAIFSSFNSLGLIILDQPENYGYREEQTLRYDTLMVAKKLSQLNCNHLVIASDVPSIENLYFEQQKKYKVLKNNINFDTKTIKLIDSNKDRGYISWQLREEIEKNLSLNKKILILVNKRGDGAYLSCMDCGHIFTCPNCNLPLVPHHKTDLNLKCTKCNFSTNSPEKCPRCAGARLKNVGLGVEKIAQEIKKIFNNVNILIIDKNDKLMNEAEIQKNKIIIGTRKILERHYGDIGLSVIIGIDNILNFPDYTNIENANMLIFKLLNMTTGKLMIQTYNIESEFMQLVANKKLKSIITNELKKRYTMLYPPYGQIAKLIYHNEDQAKSRWETKKILNELIEKNTKNILEILGPLPCFIERKRNNFYWQIIIKNKKYSGIDDFKIRDLLTNLSLKDGWRVEIDPANLL